MPPQAALHELSRATAYSNVNGMVHFMTITGYLGADATVAAVRTKNGNGEGSFVVNLNLSDHTYWRGATETHWYSVEFWGERARKVAPQLTKGALISVTGTFHLRAYEAAEGQQRHARHLNAAALHIIKGGARRDAGPALQHVGEPGESEEWSGSSLSASTTASESDASASASERSEAAESGNGASSISRTPNDMAEQGDMLSAPFVEPVERAHADAEPEQVEPARVPANGSAKRRRR